MRPLDIKEADWKTLRRLQPLALERLCKRVLEVTELIFSLPSPGSRSQPSWRPRGRRHAQFHSKKPLNNLYSLNV
jgi:hypothetical protein